MYKKYSISERAKWFSRLKQLEGTSTKEALAVLKTEGWKKPNGEILDHVFLNNQRTVMKRSPQGKYIRVKKSVGLAKDVGIKGWEDVALEILAMKVTGEVKTKLLGCILRG